MSARRREKPRSLRRRRLMAAVLVLCLFLGGAGDASAISKTVKCEVYRTSPATISLHAGETEKLRKVEKYCFTMRGRETFQSLEKFLGGLSGANYEAASYKWVSGNEKVAQVNASGEVTAVRRGQTWAYPVPRGITSWKKRGRYILYLDGNILSGVRIKAGIAAKVKVKK